MAYRSLGPFAGLVGMVRMGHFRLETIPSSKIRCILSAMTTPQQQVLQLRVTLDDTHVPIWRTVLVPGTYTFAELHQIIQITFGWQNYHSHQFLVPTDGGQRIVIVPPEPNEFDTDPLSEMRMNEEVTTLADVIPKMTSSLTYEYDFGDGWVHTITLKKVLPVSKETSSPSCIAGENACPPEDCGGAPGYQDLCAILRDHKHAEHREKLAWLGLKRGDNFDPHEFDLEGG